MKRKKCFMVVRCGLIGVLVLWLMMGVGCSEEGAVIPQPEKKSEQTLQLIAPALKGYEADTRSDVNNYWKKGDVIAVFISPDYTRQYQYIKFVNVSDDPELAVFEPEETPTWDLTQPVTITAFFPREEELPRAGKDTMHMYTDSDDDRRNDLKVAYAQCDGGSNKIEISFRRITARVDVKLYEDLLPGGKSLNDYELKLTQTYSQSAIYYYTLEMNPPTYYPHEYKMASKTFDTDAGGDYVLFTFYVFEQKIDVEYGVKLLEFLDNGVSYKTFQFPSNITEVEAGKRYVYEIKTF